jgi:hypothetical protein
MVAPVSIDISLLGDKKLERAFRRLGTPALMKKTLRKALRAGGKYLLVYIRVAAGKISQRLSRAIKLKARKRSRKWIGMTIWTPRREELDIPKSAKGHWPTHQEFGWTDLAGQYHPPRSYLRAPADERKEDVFRIVRNKLRQEIDRLWRKN